MACEKSCEAKACQGCDCDCDCSCGGGCGCKVDIADQITEKCTIKDAGVGVEKVYPPEIERKLNILLSIGEECITKEELAVLLEKKPNFIAYDGFEPSGRMHIAQVSCVVSWCSLMFEIGHFESNQCEQDYLMRGHICLLGC
jgi:hypothetical protein